MCTIFCRNVDLTMSADCICSAEGCWYCKNRCHGCLKPAGIGYSYQPNDESLLKHCSEKCFNIFTANFADSTVLDVTVGKKLPSKPTEGNYLLLSSTVLLKTGLPSNTIVSAHVFVCFNHKSIPSGVVCVYLQICSPEEHRPSIPLIIQHNLSPVRTIQKIDKIVVQNLKRGAYIKRAILPALKKHKYKDLAQFLRVEFETFKVKFMDAEGKMYYVGPTQ